MKKLLLSITICCFFSFTLTAQDIYRIKNYWKNTYLNTNEKLETSDVGNNWKSAQWQLIGVGNGQVRIKNVRDGSFLNIENETLNCSSIENGWHSALWQVNKVEGMNSYKINNVWKPDRFLNIEEGLTCSIILDGWHSAWWVLEKVDANTTSTATTNTNGQNTNASSGFFNIQRSLDAHNVLRREVGIPPLTWSPDLAAIAQQRADKVALEYKFWKNSDYNPHRGNRKGIGENIYTGHPYFGPPENRILEGWGRNEQAHFNATTRKCKRQGKCGHYTQIVWRNTTKVGCAVKVLANGYYAMVCNYSPPGNFNNQRPY